jgi:hypothetical protein
MQESTPEEQVEAILAFMNQSFAEGTLTAVGRGKRISARQASLYNMIEASGDLIADGYIEEACQQLLDAYRYTDGKSRPKDLVAGENAPTLAAMILDLMASMGCK